MQAGFINKLGAGIYTFLPFGLRVLSKIEAIVREEMNLAGGEELLMPTLQPKENWAETGRWDSFDALFKLKTKSDAEYALGPTHEEIIYPLTKHLIFSYRDLPIALYQIQTKFRDEPRAKSGLMRCREFRMKDLYSFHATGSDRDRYYEIMRKSYLKIFKRLGLDVIETKASGGTFSELSQEFQVITEAGEDTVYYCKKCKIGVNKEVYSDKERCEKCKGELTEGQAVEVGNIFPLKSKFAEDFKLTFKEKDGSEKLVEAGCYGLGTSRVMGTIVEVFNDECGIIWPESVAPFQVHLIELRKNKAAKVYKKLLDMGVEVLYDDRDLSAGEKFADADLIGIPLRAVISEKTGNKIEIKERKSKALKLVKIEELVRRLKHVR
jgi:prolyl-tRNA synthetase